MAGNPAETELESGREARLRCPERFAGTMPVPGPGVHEEREAQEVGQRAACPALCARLRSSVSSSARLIDSVSFRTA